MVVAPPTPKLHTKEVGSILNGDDPLENTISLFLVQVRHPGISGIRLVQTMIRDVQLRDFHYRYGLHHR
jgi:hypothetical protein